MAESHDEEEKIAQQWKDAEGIFPTGRRFRMDEVQVMNFAVSRFLTRANQAR